MALHTLGTKTTTSLQCSSSWLAAPPISGSAFTPADLAALDQSVVSDDVFATMLQGGSFGVQAVLATGTTASNTSLTSVAAAGGSPPITQIQVGDLVLGINIPLGTFVTVVAASGATLTISQAATDGVSAKNLAFVRAVDFAGDSGGLTPFGQLLVPNRGLLKVLPGDRVAIDNSGWPILVSGASIGYAGSQWTFT